MAKLCSFPDFFRFSRCYFPHFSAFFYEFCDFYAWRSGNPDLHRHSYSLFHQWKFEKQKPNLSCVKNIKRRRKTWSTSISFSCPFFFYSTVQKTLMHQKSCMLFTVIDFFRSVDYFCLFVHIHLFFFYVEWRRNKSEDTIYSIWRPIIAFVFLTSHYELIIMHKSVLIVLFLFGLILMISAGKGKRFSSTNDDEMVEHPRIPNVLIQKRYIQSFLNNDGPGVITNCCVKCRKRCACCIT